MLHGVLNFDTFSFLPQHNCKTTVAADIVVAYPEFTSEEGVLIVDLFQAYSFDGVMQAEMFQNCLIEGFCYSSVSRNRGDNFGPYF